MAASQAPSPLSDHFGRVAFVLGICIGLALATLNWHNIGMLIGPECTIGLTGTGATVTVKGWAARDACAEVKRQTYWPTYQQEGVLPAPVVCRYSRQGRVYTVRDEGALKVAGAALCATLR